MGSFYSHYICRIMEGAQVLNFFECIDDFRCYNNRFCKFITSVEDSVSYCFDYAHVGNYTVNRICNCIYNKFYGFLVGGTWAFQDVFFLSLCFVGNYRTVLGYPFHHSRSKNILVVPVINLILSGRASAIKCENNHINLIKIEIGNFLPLAIL